MTETLASLQRKLQLLEFARPTRYGKNCAACGGSRLGDYGYVEKGPDRGHEKECWLRAFLDEDLPA